jgi:uncharacterized protein YdeI (YjbR/CyaY-like superfamily)
VDGEPVFFTSVGEWRAWLERHHTQATEVWVGYHRTSTRRPSLTWPQSVDEALCFGWIDGVRKRVDSERYKIRFTPRRPRSHWSAVNVARVRELTEQGRMRPEGLRAFAQRREEATAQASHERTEPAALRDDEERLLRADPAAAAFFEAQPPWYRRAATHWVVSAKREETRRRRLAQLAADSAAGRAVPPLRRRG